MNKGYHAREIILELLLEINEEGAHCHIALGDALKKYQFLPKKDRAFITRVCEGTVEYAIQIDYIINYFSKIKTADMKPVIREILRSAVYQLMYMDSVPDSAVCNEAVACPEKGFYNLKPFVNGVLRTIARRIDEVEYPSKSDPIAYLSARYSMPEHLVKRWVESYGADITREMLKSFKGKPHDHPLRAESQFPGGNPGKLKEAECEGGKSALSGLCVLYLRV